MYTRTHTHTHMGTEEIEVIEKAVVQENEAYHIWVEVSQHSMKTVDSMEEYSCQAVHKIQIYSIH